MALDTVPQIKAELCDYVVEDHFQCLLDIASEKNNGDIYIAPPEYFQKLLAL